MQELLIFSFQWFEGCKFITNSHEEYFLFSNKLKADFIDFSDLINKTKPSIILGFAEGRSSYIETKTINQFHKTRKVIANAPEEISLFSEYNNFWPIRKRYRSTETFCNWVMFKTAFLLSKTLRNESTKLVFFHLKKRDIELIPEIVAFYKKLKTV